MTEHVYEGLYILDSNRYTRDPSAVSQQLTETVQQLGGEVLASRLWEERRLAYPIKGHRKGTYWLTYFRISTDKLTLLNRQCQLNENIVRNLFLKVDPRVVETLVAHAQGSGSPVIERKVAVPVVEEEAVVGAIDALGEDL
ncbi:MAG: 30S ribosomal protein S6 [Planctomycetota bacterium]|nr:30S ribosomal protein S6 [Planctomycetota bacterium]